MTNLERLSAWYTRQCDGEWEHRQGISIQSYDNPGWWVKIELKGTALESVPFARVADNIDDREIQRGPRWLVCRITNGTWTGAGDETKLEKILDLFLSWAERHNS